MSNVFSIRSKQAINLEDLKAHRKAFPATLNRQVEAIMGSVEYALYTMAMSGFDITEAVLIFPYDAEPVETVAVINVTGDRDIPKQRSLIELTYALITKQHEATNNDDEDDGA